MSKDADAMTAAPGPSAAPSADEAAELWAIAARFGAVAADAVAAGALPAIAPLGGGLINETYALGDAFVLQRLHPIFAPSVNLDIEALGAIARARGVPLPRIERADDGRPYVEVAAGARTGTWRVLERLPGRSFDKVRSPRQARSAAALVARFHAALDGVDHTFAFTRPGAHDTALHLHALAEAVDRHGDHRLYEPVARLAERVARYGTAVDLQPAVPPRIVHGDLKIANVLFDGDDATGLIDLDTMAKMGIDAELGDALRSWCNRSREDEVATLDIEVFRAALEGYGESAALTPAERESVVPGLLRISLELCARFAADALIERYFGWDPARASGRGEHNLQRAHGQLSLFEAALAERATLEAIASAALGER
jgi:Ser/Thr protein kinase RdoA (MazF antagonist)